MISAILIHLYLITRKQTFLRTAGQIFTQETTTKLYTSRPSLNAPSSLSKLLVHSPAFSTSVNGQKLTDLVNICESFAHILNHFIFYFSQRAHLLCLYKHQERLSDTKQGETSPPHTHTHTHTYIYIYPRTLKLPKYSPTFARPQSLQFNL